MTDFIFQIPATGVEEPDLDSQTRNSANIPVRRPLDMKMSNFGALEVGNRLTDDYTRTNTMAFKAKGESEDWAKLTEDTGIGSNVKLFGVSVNYNPLLVGSTVKYSRDDQFIRMSMSKETGFKVDMPAFDVMDTDVATAEGIIATSNAAIKNWPTEGWYSFGKKHDFVQNKAK